jgi:hypothetical protein
MCIVQVSVARKTRLCYYYSFRGTRNKEETLKSNWSWNNIPGFEEAGVGLNPDETKTLEIQSDQAYGPRRKERVRVVERHWFPDDLKPEVGQVPFT